MCEFRHFRSPWSQRCSPECSHPQPHSEPAWVKRWKRFEKVKVSKKTFFPEHAYFAIWATSSLLLTSHWNPQAMPPAFWRVRLGYEFSSNLFLTQESWGNRLRPSQKLPLQLRLPPVCLRQWPCWSPHQHRRRPRGSQERQGGEPAAWEAHHIVTTLFLIAKKNQLLLKVVTTLFLIPMKTGNCSKFS